MNSELDYLPDVQQMDSDALHMKAKTYKDSWKKRGGVGAFMMAARKWDRLENIVAECGYDVFTAIDTTGEGDDSAIEQIRDLRRYLLLIECEIARQNVVTDTETVAMNRHATILAEKHSVSLTTYEYNAIAGVSIPRGSKVGLSWSGIYDKNAQTGRYEMFPACIAEYGT